jgi:hypothetical protein
MVDAEKKLVRNYMELDLNFVHSDYAPKMATDDDARLNHDWYAFSVLCYWLVTKSDPFGDGKVISNPKADRIYRMEKNILSQSSSKVETDEKSELFVKRAIERLSPIVRRFIRAFAYHQSSYLAPDFLLKEFRDDNIVTCKAKIQKHGRTVHCRFKQLAGFGTCGYCKNPNLEMTATPQQPLI